MPTLHKCECECGCKTKTLTKLCVSCEWDRIDAASGMFLDKPGVKKHLRYVKGKKVHQAGPFLFVD